MRAINFSRMRFTKNNSSSVNNMWKAPQSQTHHRFIQILNEATFSTASVVILHDNTVDERTKFLEMTCQFFLRCIIVQIANVESEGLIRIIVYLFAHFTNNILKAIDLTRSILQNFILLFFL